jgi:hypothetical protein
LKSKEHELLDAIEYSLYMYPGVEGVCEEYKHELIKGYCCPIVDHANYNRVGMARLSEDQVDQGIKDVINYFTSRGVKNIGWNLSPQSKPENLIEKLQEFGFEKKTPHIGMALSTSEELNIDGTDEFIIKKYEEDDAVNMFKELEIQEILEKAFRLPEGGARVFGMLSGMFKDIDFLMYVAYDKETNEAIAYSSMSTVPNTKFAILNGAATLPEYRKKGIYTTMLKLRQERARKKGIEYLIIQAVENTSAPIAAKNGFKKICVLPIYTWNAEKSDKKVN